MSSPNPNPINYTTLFGRLGKFVKWFNLWFNYQNTGVGLSTAVDIDGQFTARPDLVQTLPSTLAGFQSNVQGWNQYAKSQTDGILQDLQQSLSAPSNDTGTIVPLLVGDMILNSQTVQKNTVAALNITSGVLSTNIGTGILSGFQNTSNGIPDERIIVEYVVFNCTSDQFSGTNPGGESFSIQGYPSQSYYVANYNRGNGSGTPISVANESGVSLLTNGDFDDASTLPYPNNWNVSAGASLCNLSSSVVHPATGGYSLQLSGDGSTTLFALSQNLPQGSLSTHSVFAVGFWARKGGTVTSGSNITFNVSGTNYNTTTNTLDPSTLTTTFQYYKFTFALQSYIPANLNLSISWMNANAAGGSAIVYIDDAFVVAPTYFGNVGYWLTRGNVDFEAADPPLATGDSFGVLTSNNFAGVFQTFFGLAYNVALPSSGSPSISDTLAQ